MVDSINEFSSKVRKDVFWLAKQSWFKSLALSLAIFEDGQNLSLCFLNANNFLFLGILGIFEVILRVLILGQVNKD